MDILCPLCRQPLSATEKSWHCANKHSFDKARQGYTNLLPVQHKKSRQPGDSADMVAARWRFLSAGYYQPVSDRLNTLVSQFIHRTLQPDHRPVAIIDAGCGEGYYTSRLARSLTARHIEHQAIGIDISKHAALTAAKRDKTIGWYVANSTQLPVNDQACDVLLNLFAPVANAEFHRCLKPGRLLLIATTGANHLIELRQALYDTVNDKVFNPATALDARFQHHQQHTVTATIQLTDNPAIQDLLAMTPHYWRAPPAGKQRIDRLEQLSVSVDIQLHCYIAQPGAATC